MKRRVFLRARAEAGATVVEFAIAGSAFLILMFGAIEVARLMFVWNSLQEVTRRAARAAVVTDFTDTSALTALKNAAVLSNGSGSLFGSDISADHLRISYLNRDLAEVEPLPASPNANIANCATTPGAANCIRFVRVQVCASGAGMACDAVHYVPVVP